MKAGFLRRLVKEDFKPADQDLIGKIAYILNPALETITQILTNRINFTDNINSSIKDITLLVDSTGTPTSPINYVSGVTGTTQFLLVGKVTNLDNSSVYPTGYPFISWTDNSGTIAINNITGLVAGTNYQIRVITIGS